MQPKEEYVLQLLESARLITRAQIDGVQARCNNGVTSTVDALIDAELVSAVEVSRTLAAQAQMDWIDLSATVIPPEVIGLMAESEARRFQVIPIGVGETGLTVAVGNPLDLDLLDSLSFLLKQPIHPVCTSPQKILEALTKYYGAVDPPSNPLEQEGAGRNAELDLEISPSGNVDNNTTESDAPIVRLVSMILVEAQRLGASDVHLEPLDQKFQVRFRIDGVLREMQAVPKRLQSAMVSRLKIMTGSMSIAEKRLPEDGRIQVRISGKPIDLRVSTIPTSHGESVVMRVLDQSSLLLGLPELGFLRDDQDEFERLLRLPDGILLVTGPTGSGKTSTLYSCLNFINHPDRKIITVEDPVEYRMAGINQVQVNSEVGMTFPVALRSILRQAPNVIMIGEIRDLETATIATNASLTGHLVFSTLHTNDAPAAVARLVDLGVQPFLVASSMRAIIAQRLVRRLCPACKRTGNLSETVLRALNLRHTPRSQLQILEPAGCEKCRDTGYKGRLGIFEIFILNDDTRHLINQRTSTAVLRQHARQLGMRTLREDGVRKMLAGLTSSEEIISATIGDLA